MFQLEIMLLIGNNTIIHANVTIENNVKIGTNCVFFSGSRIGTDGFGYAPDDDGSWSKIPQTGSVLLKIMCILVPIQQLTVVQ